MLYSSDRSSLNDWTQRLESILYRDAKIARALTHKLAKKTKTVSGNWLRTYLLDCPDRASRSCSMKIFVAAMGSCASINTELRALEVWTQAWREIGERLWQDFRESNHDIVRPYPASLTGQWESLENPDTLDGGESSCLGIILSFTNILLEYMPRCWRFSTELCEFIRSLASLKRHDQRQIFRWAMVEAMMPARIICLVARERSSRFLQLAFPGSSISSDVANTQVRVESSTSSVMTMGGNQVMGSSDINNGRQSSFDYRMLLEALACLAGLPGVVSTPVTIDIEEPGRGRNRTTLTPAAIDALRDIFFDHCTPRAPGMSQREVEFYLRSSGVDANAASSQKIADMMAKYPVTSDGQQGIAYLSVEGFLAYYRDMAQTNDVKVQLDLHKHGFRPDLTRRSRDARIQRINDHEVELRAPESVAWDVAENLDQQVNFGLLTGECLNSFGSGIFPVAFEVSEPLALYLVAAAVWRRADPERIITHFLKVIHQTPNDWNANATLSNAAHALMVIACLPDEDQMSRIGIIMQSSAQYRGCEYGLGLLNVLRYFQRSRQTQHFNNEYQWGIDRYVNIVKSLQRVYPVESWMQENRDKCACLERDIMDERSSGMQHRHHAQPRGDYGTRDIENNHMPLDHHSHTDSDMADMNDSEDDDEITTDAFGHVANEGPYQVVIESAGTPEVNGVYNQDGYFENACKYFREGKWKNSLYKFFIFQCNVSNNTKHWYISIVPYGGNPGTSSDIDFYSAPATHECARIPPTKGWVKALEGLEPAPELSFRTKDDNVLGVVVVGNEDDVQQDEENEENQSWPMDGPGDEPDENITGTGSTSSSGGGGGGGPGNNTGVQDLRSRYI
jgi:ubiquitin carboxyl-terminal hydrolase 9/24